MTENAHSIFINYASPDQKRVLPFCEWIEKQGFNVWMDCRQLKPGQNSEFEINRALEKATFILSFISKISVERRSYLQREMKFALDKRSEKLVDDIYIIPVLLDDGVQIPDQLKVFHCIRSSDSQCREQIADALKHQLTRLGIERREIQEKQQVYWTAQVKREEWDGIPGYEAELQFLEFESDRYPNVSEISEYLKGKLLPNLFECRELKLSPLPELFNYGQDKPMRTNTYDAHCGEPDIVGKVISIQYAIHWYNVGTAHPNHHFQTYSFLLEPVILIQSLENIFREPETALETVRADIRQQLYQILVDNASEDETVKHVPEFIDKGTQSWEDFTSFVFRPNGIDILFAPYDVAPYAFGPQFAEIRYEKIASLMRNEYVSALEIQHLIR